MPAPCLRHARIYSQVFRLGSLGIALDEILGMLGDPGMIGGDVIRNEIENQPHAPGEASACLAAGHPVGSSKMRDPLT